MTTFLGRYSNNYDGEVRAFWRRVLDTLPEQSRIIDLGTGNGALALLAAAYGREHGRDLRVTAIDYAQIDPANVVLKGQDTRGIEFLSGVSMEQTGLIADTFDAAVSQFGFEYGDPEATVREVSRVLKSDAVLALMLHREGSVLQKQAVTGSEQVIICLESGLHDKLKPLLKRLELLRVEERDPASDETAEALREEINDITNDLHEEMESRDDPTQLGFYLENSMAVFRPQFRDKTAAEKSEMLDQVQEETLAYRQRMEDLMSAARSDQDMANLTELLKGQGFTIEMSEAVQVEGHDFGQALVARR